jgi:hypothetical protein
MLIVLGLGYGSYTLLEYGEIGTVEATFSWTKTLLLAGITIGFFGTIGGTLFVEASSCTSPLPILVPWTAYWMGCAAVATLLVSGRELTYGWG